MNRFSDSFSHYNTASLTLKYSNISGINPSISAGVGRFGGDALKVAPGGDGNPYYVEKTLDSQGTWIASFSRKTVTVAGAASRIFSWFDGTTPKVELRQDTSGHFYVTQNGGSALGTSTAISSINVYRNIVFKVKIHSSTGTVDVWMDGVSILSLTGLNTSGGGANTADKFRIEGNGNEALICDLHIMDDQGGVNDDYTGGYEMRVDLFSPSSDATPNQFTVTGTTDHFDAINDASPDGDSTYLADSVSADRELFGYTDTSVTGVIVGVQLVTCARKDDAGVIGLKAVLKSGATTNVGSSHALTTSYAMYEDAYDVDPNTSAAWTAANFNSAQAGFEVA